jgi:uncharacterized protein (TIGR02246 family)
VKTTWAVLALIQVGCASRPSAEFSAQDEAAVRAVADSSVAYLKAGKPDAWAELYAEDGVLYPPNHPAVRGRSALREYARGVPVENVEFSDVQVQGNGSMAYGTSAVIFKLKRQPADTGKQLWVARRSPAGKWEVVVVSFNSNLAPAGTK